MNTHTIETQWMGNMQFNALVNGHTVVMDAPERAGGQDNGPIPKPFVLASLSGCTGMDIVALLKKNSHLVDNLNIIVTGELSTQISIEYTAIHLVYEFTGKEVDKLAALDAVMQSQEKYCGVSHMLKKALPVTWQVTFNGKSIFNNQPLTSGID